MVFHVSWRQQIQLLYGISSRLRRAEFLPLFHLTCCTTVVLVSTMFYPRSLFKTFAEIHDKYIMTCCVEYKILTEQVLICGTHNDTTTTAVTTKFVSFSLFVA